MSNQDFLVTITNMGESFVLGMLSLALFVYFLIIGYRREAIGIIAAFLLPAALIGLLKIIFYSCNANLYGVVSPSGHAAISIGVLGTLALMMAKICIGWGRAVLPIILVTLALTIAISRTLLGMHTDGDVFVGSGIGLGTVFLVARFMSRRAKSVDTLGAGALVDCKPPRRSAHPTMLCGIILTTVLLGYGIRLPSEAIMKSFAKQIRPYVGLCGAESK